MGAVILLLLIIGGAVLFAYLKFPPPYANKKLVGTFDLMVLGVCAVLCLACFFSIREHMMGTTDDSLWQSFAVAGMLLIESVFLGLCFLLRNFFVFRPPRHPGRGGWF